MTSLKLELSTLSTSYASLQSTLVLLQTQLVDLKRVNQQVQEENESYMILLREKTLSGQFDVMKQVGGQDSSEDGENEDDEDDDGEGDADESGDVGSLRSIGRSVLDRVEEEETPTPEESLEQELERGLEPRRTDSPTSSRPSRPTGRQGRKRTTSTSSHSPSSAHRGESLADLPITGPGLDLAAELGRAENKDILDGHSIEERDRSILNGKVKRTKKGSESRKVSTSDAAHAMDPSGPTTDIDALRTEVKSLKDANKALSLYASKIIDRIISQEGFEHVLAVDYDKLPATPTTATQPSNSNGHKSPPSPARIPKARPQSVIVGRSTSNPTPALGAKDSPGFNSPPLTAAPKSGSSSKTQRRSLSFDWKSFSLFGGTESKPENPSLRPLTLQPGASPVTGARKLETQEDEEDKKERARLQATMKLMGIDQSAVAPSPATAVPTHYPSPGSPPPSTTQARFSFFRTKSATENSDTSSVHSTPSLHGSSHSRVGLGVDGPSNLTQEALAQAEAENSLAALDAHERALSAEMARGASGGFTEIAPRGGGLGDEWRSRRSRKSGGGSGSGVGSGSGSTVWSAGMGKSGEDGDD